MKERICPRCNTEYGTDTNFCPKCGTSLITNPEYQKYMEERWKREQELEGQRNNETSILNTINGYKDILNEVGINVPYRYDQRDCDRIFEALHYLVFYETSKESVCQELITLSEELRKIYLGNIRSKMNVISSEIESKKDNPNINYYAFKKALEADQESIEIIRCFLDGGYITYRIFAEPGYVSYGSWRKEIRTSQVKCYFSGNLMGRIINQVKNCFDNKQAGKNAYLIKNEIIRMIEWAKNLLVSYKGDSVWSWKNNHRYSVIRSCGYSCHSSCDSKYGESAYYITYFEGDGFATGEITNVTTSVLGYVMG